MAAKSAAVTAPKDHRVRVARARRDRMNQRLLNAVLECYASSPRRTPPTVDDVIQKAKVSRATFYKYFSSVEEASGILGRDLGMDMVRGLITLFEGPEDPLFRVSTVILVFLMRAVIDPVWARFISHTDYLTQDTEPLIGVTAHLARARDDGLLQFSNVDPAATLAVGSMMEAIKRMARTGQRTRQYVEDVAALIMRGLGMNMDDARNVVRERTIFIRGLAPDRLGWWRDPWA